MKLSILLFLWLLTLTVAIPNFQHQIYVDSLTGANNVSCWEGGYSNPCLSLNLAFKGAQHFNHSVAIFLQPGCHELDGDDPNQPQLRSISQLAIVGNGSEGEVIICCPLGSAVNHGLAFRESENIEIQNVSITGCGVLQNSTSRDPEHGTYMQIYVALFVLNTRNISLLHVEVSSSIRAGVVLYNATGVVSVVSSKFVGNGQEMPIPLGYGGGGLAFESAMSDTRFIIKDSVFVNNLASSGQYTPLFPGNNIDESFSLGRGGGLSVVFREGVANNVVELSSVRLERNTAQFGGGLYLALHDNASMNSVGMNDCDLIGNKATQVYYNDHSYSGGGMFVLFLTNKVLSKNNTLSIFSSRFISNEADYGGGFSIEVLNRLNIQLPFESTNNLTFDNCTFSKNSAYQGSSAFFYQDSNRYHVNTMIAETTFSDGHCISFSHDYPGFTLPCSGNVYVYHLDIIFNGTIVLRDNGLSGLTMSSSHVELLPGTQLYFINNTALEGAGIHLVDCSAVLVSSNSAIYFDSNNAESKGGAIYAENCGIALTGGRQCFIRHVNVGLHPDNWEANFVFINNKASDTDNSIYVNSIHPCVMDNYETFCWIGWNYTGSINENEDKCESQLKSDAAYTVYVDREHNNITRTVTVFPGEIFELSPITVRDDWDRDIRHEISLIVQVLSGPLLLAYYNVSGGYYERPRRTLILTPEETRDIILLADCSNNEGYYEETSVLSVGPPRVSAKVNVHFKSCEEATPLNGTYCSTHYGCLQQIQGYVGCGNCYSFLRGTFTNSSCPYLSDICIQSSACMSVDDTSGLPYNGPCPFSYKNEKDLSTISPYIRVPVQVIFSSKYKDINQFTCAANREGTLCGRCSEEYGVAYNSPDFVCARCDSSNGISSAGGFLFLFLGILPVFVMMTILAVLHINLTDGYLNGFILYSQLVTLQFPGFGYPSWVFTEKVYSTLNFSFEVNALFSSVYSIWNLNFLIVTLHFPVCILSVDTALKVLALQYVVAFCPLVFIMVSYIWIQLYSRGYRVVVCITRPVHKILARFWQKFGIQPSLIDTYAGLLVLSFMRFLAVSIKVLQYTFVVQNDSGESFIAFYYDANIPYFGWSHALLGVFAILCLLVFVFPLIFILLFYHLKIFQKCLSCCKLDRPGLTALVDSYQGCFKNSASDDVERRYFAGIYLFFRLYIGLFLIGIPIAPILSNKPAGLNLSPILIVEAGWSFLLAGLVILLRPYKKTTHNVIDFCLLFYMMLIAIMSFVSYDLSSLAGYFMIYLPALVLLFYLLYKLMKLCYACCKCKRSHQLLTPGQPPINNVEEPENSVQHDPNSPLHVPVVTHSSLVLSDYVADDMFADRLLKPAGYRPRYQAIGNSTNK